MDVKKGVYGKLLVDNDRGVSSPLISILVRTSNRPVEFARMWESIKAQTYRFIDVIVAFDNDEALKYIPKGATKLKVVPDRHESYFWNLYCNTLKDHVSDGWFFYMDDDDFLFSNESVERMVKYLEDPERGYICRFKRGDRVKPDENAMRMTDVIKGNIGGGCIWLHHSKKAVANWDGAQAADYRFIKNIQAMVPLVFVPLIVQQAGNGGLHGKI